MIPIKKRFSLSSVLSFISDTEERESYGFGSPDFLRYSCFPVIGLCLWEEEASPVLLRRLLFFREAVVFAFSGLLRFYPIKTFCASLAQLTLESRSCDSIDVDLIPLVPSGEGG